MSQHVNFEHKGQENDFLAEESHSESNFISLYNNLKKEPKKI